MGKSICSIAQSLLLLSFPLLLWHLSFESAPFGRPFQLYLSDFISRCTVCLLRKSHSDAEKEFSERAKGDKAKVKLARHICRRRGPKNHFEPPSGASYSALKWIGQRPRLHGHKSPCPPHHAELGRLALKKYLFMRTDPFIDNYAYFAEGVQ